MFSSKHLTWSDDDAEALLSVHGADGRYQDWGRKNSEDTVSDGGARVWGLLLCARSPLDTSHELLILILNHSRCHLAKESEAI